MDQFFPVRKDEKTSSLIRSSESINEIYKTFHNSRSSIFRTIFLKIETQCLSYLITKMSRQHIKRLRCCFFSSHRNPQTNITSRIMLRIFIVSKDEKSASKSFHQISKRAMERFHGLRYLQIKCHVTTLCGTKLRLKC